MGMTEGLHPYPWINGGIHTRGHTEKPARLTETERTSEGVETEDAKTRLIREGERWAALDSRHFMTIHWSDGSVTRIDARGTVHLQQTNDVPAVTAGEAVDASSLEVGKVEQWTVLEERESDNALHAWPEYLCFAKPGMLAVCHEQPLGELCEGSPVPDRIDGIEIVAVRGGFAVGPIVPREDKVVIMAPAPPSRPKQRSHR